MANKVSPITLQSNDVAQLGAQGNSIIAHSNGLMSIRAAGSNEKEAINPFDDDCSGIYASPGGIALNAQASQTNYQTIITEIDDYVEPEPSSPCKSILIGDSQTPSIKNNSRKLQPIGPSEGLWKSGWFVKDLLKAVKAYAKDDTIDQVFINIGTNGAYQRADKIEDLVDAITVTFPNAKKYVIEGSTGWSTGVNNDGYSLKTVTRAIIDAYYKRFTDKGVTKLTNAIGSDPNHPNDSTPGIKKVGAEIDDLITKCKTVPLPKVENRPLPKNEVYKSPTIINEEDIPEGLVLVEDALPDKEDIVTNIVSEGEVEDETENRDALNDAFAKLINSLDNEIDLGGGGGGGGGGVKIISKGDIDTYMVAYMLHQQGPAGCPSMLYYTFKQPIDKLTKGKSKFARKVNIHGNQYGCWIYDSYKNANVGRDFITKLFPAAGSDVATSRHTRYLNKSGYYKGYIDPSYFTTSNFTAYWAYKWKTIYKNNKDKVIKDSTVSAVITKWAQYYGVPLDFAKACCAVESGFNPNSGGENANYKGLYAIGRSEWKKFFGNSSNWARDVHDADMNAKCGIHLLKEHLKKANQVINECVL
jgi:hypothetical protein